MERLPDRARENLLSLGTEASLPPNRELLRQGEYGATVWLLLDALTKVTARLPDGNQALLAIRISGDVVGEMGPMAESPRSATVTTCGRAHACQIRWPDFAEFLLRQPTANLVLTRMTAERLRWANQRRLDFTGYEASVCLARVLVTLAERHSRPGPTGIRIDVPLTRAELGGMVGVKEVTVQKALRGLADCGLIQRLRNRAILITDLQGLAAYAQLDLAENPPNPY